MTEETLADYLWRTRYRDPSARPAERGIGDSWDRIAHAVAAVEQDAALWRRRFREELAEERFLPSGRILAGAGSERQVTLFSCFVMGAIQDSLTGIFEALKEGAVTMQQGGGVGYDFSSLRPRGAHARASGAIASGPVSFMRVWDAMCATIVSTGARRGAMMATLRCDHPDIEEFIDAKRSPEALSYFNLSVLVSDAFMVAVREDRPWPLTFAQVESGIPCIARTVGARDLWRRLTEAALRCAEPGVLFIDRINRENNLGYCEHLTATNPCAEEPLPPYGACNLGSLNLTAFVTEPFGERARFDVAGIEETVRVAVRFLDDVIEISQFPLPAQREQARRSRRIGLGVTGLADALAMLGLRYDAQPAREAAARVLRVMRDAAYQASLELARERGAFPALEVGRYLERPFMQRLPDRIRQRIRREGIRNSHLLAIAPAGTISLLAGNLSSGIEPIFRTAGERRIIDPAGGYRRFPVTDWACALWSRHNPGVALPGCFVDQSQVSPLDQLHLQAAVQPFVDGSISKTVTLPEECTATEVAQLLEEAYDLGLKGCTVFREGARAGVLTETAHAEDSGVSAPRAHCCELERESD